MTALNFKTTSVVKGTKAYSHLQKPPVSIPGEFPARGHHVIYLYFHVLLPGQTSPSLCINGRLETHRGTLLPLWLEVEFHLWMIEAEMCIGGTWSGQSDCTWPHLAMHDSAPTHTHIRIRFHMTVVASPARLLIR